MDLDAAKENERAYWRLGRVATWVCFAVAVLILLTSLFGALAEPTAPFLQPSPHQLTLG